MTFFAFLREFQYGEREETRKKQGGSNAGSSKAIQTSLVFSYPTTVFGLHRQNVRNSVNYAKTHYAGKYTRIDIRFKARFCYIDAFQEPYVPDDYDPSLLNETREEYFERLTNTPIHLCRLRYMGDEERWTMAVYSYSHMRYEPSVFDNGDFYGTLEEAFQASSVYLDD